MEFTEEDYNDEAVTRILSRFRTDQILMYILINKPFIKIEPLLNGIVKYLFDGFHDNYNVNLKEIQKALIEIIKNGNC